MMFCSNMHACFSWMRILNDIEEVFVLFVSAAFSSLCQCFINIQSVLPLAQAKEQGGGTTGLLQAKLPETLCGVLL